MKILQYRYDIDPATKEPVWLLHLAAWMKDVAGPVRRDEVVSRLAKVLLSPLSASQWTCAEYAVRAAIVRVAVTSLEHPSVVERFQRVVDLCDVVSAGKTRDVEDFLNCMWSVEGLSKGLPAYFACRPEPEAVWRAADAVRDDAAGPTPESREDEETWKTTRIATSDQLIDVVLKALKEHSR